MFKQPCFIRKNTPELIAQLRDLGYVIPLYVSQFHSLAVNNTQCYGISEMDIIKLPQSYIDCGKNEALFLALAALRNDSDINQLFVHNKNQYRWLLCNTHSLNDCVAIKKDWHKAHPAELIEHFK